MIKHRNPRLKTNHVERFLFNPDSSYLMEPIKGLLLFVIARNTYVPQDYDQLSDENLGVIIYYPAVDLKENKSPELRAFLGEGK